MSRIKLTIAYVGTDFHGWQRQAAPAGEPEQPTIQATLMQAVEDITGTKIHVHGSGRTDSGVHAKAQVGHMDVPDHLDHLDWQLALNTKLPPSIRVANAECAPVNFHAQHSAIHKTYCYSLWLSWRYTPPHLYPFVWGCGALNEEKMFEAALLLQGTHDFSAMRNAGTHVKSTVRTVTRIRREPVQDGSLMRVWTFEADGFLKQMVRNLMGLLVRVGQGKVHLDAIPALLAQGDRRHAGMTAPARGLCLQRVWYEGDMVRDTPDDAFIQ